MLIRALICAPGFAFGSILVYRRARLHLQMLVKLLSDDMSKTDSRTLAFERTLRDAGVRMTRQRRTILEVLAESENHPDANDLFRLVLARDTSISLSTVYRTMRILEQRGAIQRHAFDDGRARFEHADREHHDHLIDVETGKVVEFRSEKIEKLQAEIAAELGYDIVRHRLELYGVKRGGRAR